VTESELWKNLPLIALVFICLMMFGCNSPEVVRPSELLTRDCVSPRIQGVTYRDAIILAIEQAKALEECTERMRALR